MKKYTLLLAGALLTACGDNTDVEEFEKKQANAAKNIAEQQANVKMEEETISPCAWASLNADCSYVEFNQGLYAIDVPDGNILIKGPLDAVKISHKNFTNFVNVIVDYAAAKGVALNEESVKYAKNEHIKTKSGYVLSVYTEEGDFHLLEDGRIIANLTTN